MGLVWKARDARLDRLAAIKTLPADKPPTEAPAPVHLGGEGRFRVEPPEHRQHPRHRVGERCGRHRDGVLAGKTLAQLIPRRGVRADPVLRCGPNRAALAKAHAAGIVYRDLKPGHVIVTSEAPSSCSILASPSCSRRRR